MAYSRFLLLLIGVISFFLPEADARAVDFCKSQNRRLWIKHAEDLIQKVLLQKYAEVVGALKVFEVELQEPANQVKSNCRTHLTTIIHRTTNYVLILESQKQNGTVAVSPHMDVSSSLTDVLKAYQQLLEGKLEHFFKALCDETTGNG